MSDELIPFARKIGITVLDDGTMELLSDESIYNHVRTIAASAQFTLAEISSGEYLKQIFPELVGKVVPLLRDSKIKFKKGATVAIRAYPTVDEDSIVKFNSQFERKGRSSIAVSVEVKDMSNDVTCTGTFSWYVQKI